MTVDKPFCSSSGKTTRCTAIYTAYTPVSLNVEHGAVGLWVVNYGGRGFASRWPLREPWVVRQSLTNKVLARPLHLPRLRKWEAKLKGGRKCFTCCKKNSVYSALRLIFWNVRNMRPGYSTVPDYNIPNICCLRKMAVLHQEPERNQVNIVASLEKRLPDSGSIK